MALPSFTDKQLKSAPKHAKLAWSRAKANPAPNALYWGPGLNWMDSSDWDAVIWGLAELRRVIDNVYSGKVAIPAYTISLAWISRRIKAAAVPGDEGRAEARQWVFKMCSGALEEEMRAARVHKIKKLDSIALLSVNGSQPGKG